MKPPDLGGGEAVVAAAAIRAMMDARWEAADLLSRKSPSAAQDFLRARAAELATSWSGRDQVMSVALDAAADDLQQGSPPLGSGALFFFARPPAPADKVDVQRAVFARLGAEDLEVDNVVARLEAEHRGELSGASAFAELSRRLLNDARLHKHLWDDPRIPAGPDLRLVMLCSVPRLIDRARAIDPMRLRTVHALFKWPRGGAAHKAK